MKPIRIDKETETEILKQVVEKFRKEWDSFKTNMNEPKLNFSFDLSQPAKEKVTILYSQKAYLRMMALVDFFDTEVSWYGLVEKLEDRLYYVYDVKVCKQYVNGSKVDTDDDDTLEFFNSLTDEEAEHMHFQAHSHVRMGTSASGVDLQNQADVVKNMGSTGYYIFQIWNKNNDINTYMYDLDNNVFYDRKDVVIEVEDNDGTLSEFVNSVKELVVERKLAQFYPVYPQVKGKGKKKAEPAYLPGYWDGVNYNGYGDW